jgi:uridine kinase
MKDESSLLSLTRRLNKMVRFIRQINYRLVERGSFLLKLGLLGLFSSDVSSLLFQPFLSTFVEGNLNPWDYYLEKNLNIDAFPYHGLMLLLHVVPALILKIVPDIIFLKSFVFKLPLLLSDLLLYITLLKMFPNARKKVIIYYFLNPIIIYSIYIHSQLDIIPTTFLLVSIFVMNKRLVLKSAVLFGLALSTKIHVLVVLPLLVYYVYKKFTRKEAILYSIIPVVILFIFDGAFLFSDGFQEMVLLNPKQSLIFDSYYSVSSLKIFLPILAVTLIYFHFFLQIKVNSDLLNFYITALYVLIIIFIYPAPGWYVWLVPFVTVYFLRLSSTRRTLLFHVIFSGIYLIFFVFFHESGYNDVLLLDHPLDIKFSRSQTTNLVYTSLESSLIIVLYLLYRHGINSNSVYKTASNLTIGIGGDSGVGKTTYLSNLSLLLGDKLLKLEGDGEHKWERGNENWQRLTHLDPKANNIHQQAQAIRYLKNNKKINRSEYDHKTGTFTAPSKVEPRDFIAISGLHPFYLPVLRKTLDIKIFIDTDEKLRQHWKIIRDTRYRGYTVDKILAQIESRKKDSEKYIHPQKHFSDLTIQLYTEDDFELGNEDSRFDLWLKITLDASINLDRVVDSLGCPLIWDYNEDLATQYLIFKEDPDVDFKNLAFNTIRNAGELLSEDSIFLKGYDGFIQYLTLLLISEELKENR